ncbi:MAG: hypothetical protein HS129_04895 [Leptospiraceae bacterium]|nr:hypothetical protein [Leptospiraceae bacterium]
METEKIGIGQELSAIKEKLESGEIENLRDVEAYCRDKDFSDEETNDILNALQEETGKKKTKKESKEEEAPSNENKSVRTNDGRDFVQSSIDALKNIEKQELFSLITGIMDAQYRPLNVRVSGAMSAILDRASSGIEDGATIVSELSDEVAKLVHQAKFNEYCGMIESIYKTIGTAVETKLSQMAQATDDYLKSLGK